VRGLLTSSTAGSVGGPGKGFGPRERCWSGVAGLRMVGQVADWFRAHPLYRMPPSHRRTIRRKSWKRTLSTIAFPFSSGKMMIDYLILRQGTYPQGRGTRPSHTVLPGACRRAELPAPALRCNEVISLAQRPLLYGARTRILLTSLAAA